ncbi:MULTISPECIES: phage neck terminator protein [Pseudomonas]|uniref:phage neck terminator protein n=1 Tax=Pseudomonas TaxID=286 RepID=UPI00235E8BA1|nr:MULTISPECIES: hypothetical protein [Pseudomonas]WJV25915.1 hypothetical protein PSR66_07770 [Pseudomonas chlororaphis]
MTNEELFKKLRPIVMLATGVPVCLLADQGGPGSMSAPKGAYATITPRQYVGERGQANVISRDIPGDLVEFEVRAQIMCSASINFYRGEALMYAERLKQANKRPDISMMLFKAKIGWNSADGVNNLTSLQSANFEQRSQITLRLMYEAISLSEINNILSVEVALENEKAQVLQTFTVEVDPT